MLGLTLLAHCVCQKLWEQQGNIFFIKRVTSPSALTCSVLKRKYGSSIQDRRQKLDRWIEHYNELYVAGGSTSRHYRIYQS